MGQPSSPFAAAGPALALISKGGLALPHCGSSRSSSFPATVPQPTLAPAPARMTSRTQKKCVPHLRCPFLSTTGPRRTARGQWSGEKARAPSSGSTPEIRGRSAQTSLPRKIRFANPAEEGLLVPTALQPFGVTVRRSPLASALVVFLGQRPGRRHCSAQQARAMAESHPGALRSLHPRDVAGPRLALSPGSSDATTQTPASARERQGGSFCPRYAR